MKISMTPVMTAPTTTSMRSYRRSSGRSRLSTAYDWMKARPQGASVVPTVAVAIRIASRVSGKSGTTRPRAVAPQSGPAISPDTM